MKLVSRVVVQEAPFDLAEEYKQLKSADLNVGAVATFVGTVRDINEGDSVDGLQLEHYPGMTEKQLEEIVNEADQNYELLEGLLLHRVGTVEPGEDIVLVSAWAPHRKDAFGACRKIMEALKSTAPFWKKEELANGGRWVTKNTPGE